MKGRKLQVARALKQLYVKFEIHISSLLLVDNIHDSFIIVHLYLGLYTDIYLYTSHSINNYFVIMQLFSKFNDKRPL